jgi:hypothetical protein
MTIRPLLSPACCCLICWFALTGCRPEVDQLAAVNGKVLYRGRPVQGGTIVFIPDNSRGTHGNLASADIQPDGTFTLKTNDVLGALPGHHRVTISWVQQQAPGSLPRSLLPLKYRDPQQSGVTCEVQPNKMNTIDLDLQ